MRRAEVPVERKRLLQFADRSRSAIGLDLDEAQPEMRPIVTRRDRNPLDQQRLGLSQALSPMLGSEDRADQHVGSRCANKSVNVGRIERHGALEIAAGSLDVGHPAFIELLNALEIKVHGIQVRHILGALCFRGDELRAQLIGELGDNFVLHVEKVGHRLVEPVCPQVVAGDGVDELDIDAHPVGAALNASLKNVAHVEFAADLLGVDRFPFVRGGGVARDYNRIVEAREVGRQALGHAVDKHLVLKIHAKTGERQHHDRQARRRGPLGGNWAWRRAGLGRRTNLERIDPDRLDNILEFSLAKVADHEIETAFDLSVSVLRQADCSGLRYAFETRGDIDAVTHQVSVALFDHVSEMNANPELNAALRRQAGVALQESMLQLDRAADCIDHAAKFDDEAVARALDYTSAMNGDGGLDQVAPQRA